MAHQFDCSDLNLFSKLFFFPFNWVLQTSLTKVNSCIQVSGAIHTNLHILISQLAWWCNHFPGKPTAVPKRSLSEEPSTNTQLKPPLTQLNYASLGPITDHQRDQPLPLSFLSWAVWFCILLFILDSVCLGDISKRWDTTLHTSVLSSLKQRS